MALVFAGPLPAWGSYWKQAGKREPGPFTPAKARPTMLCDVPSRVTDNPRGAEWKYLDPADYVQPGPQRIISPPAAGPSRAAGSGAPA
ncbi:MAG: hypothetical protein PSU94_10935 [Lacunisphaera sp.]|nr:hypothetical protein [Lacunisphaera sp.]